MLKRRRFKQIVSLQDRPAELHLVIVLAGMQRVEIEDAVDTEDQAVAVFDLVEPLRAGWQVLAERRQSELELGHEPKLGTLDRYCESPSKTSRSLIPR